MLEVATERMFAEPSILETIVSVTLVLRLYESAGGSAPSATPEAAEAVPGESSAGAESAAVVPALSPSREGQETSLPQPAETAAPTAVVTTFDAAVGVVEEVGPSSPRSVAAGADEVPVTGELAADLQERVAP
jgi:predicted component of type VI protein secretion system